MNILNFDGWIINEKKKEKFDVVVKPDDDEKDDITISAPNGNNTIKYSIDNNGGENVKCKHISNENDNDDGEIVTDTRLKKDILHASHLIGRIQDEIRANELDRLTGGDITSKTKEIISILDDCEERNEDRKNIYTELKNLKEDEGKDFWTNQGETRILKLSNYIKSKLYKFDDDRLEKVYNIQSKGLGRGEYLLPLLFTDIYKQPIYTEEKKVIIIY